MAYVNEGGTTAKVVLFMMDVCCGFFIWKEILMDAFKELSDRGFIAQITHEEELIEEMAKGPVCYYTGFDATSDSLTAGHMIPVMAMAHMQRAGHIPVVLIGGGTTMIGDPSDRNDMRKMMTRETIQHNAEIFRQQLSRFLTIEEGKGYMDDNANWLLDLNYVEFIREIGVHFSVNKMLAAECYKRRMGDGLTFFEFNYMIMQAYDFLYLNRKYGTSLQMGGDDQWSNILAGADLIRRKEQKKAFGMTLKLLTLPSGEKMGKTAGGAIYLDPKKTSPYEFYQYFRNTPDSDVNILLKRLTFLPLEEIAEYEKLEGKDLNKVKEILAFDITERVHGTEEAEKAKEASRAIFSVGVISEDMPEFKLPKAKLEEGLDIADLLVEIGLTKTKGEGKRLIGQSGISLNDVKVEDPFQKITEKDFEKSYALVQKGKKVFIKVTLE